jgi:hypothetical protein
MSFTYSTFTAALANWLAVPASDTAFVEATPQIIQNAELRVYKDLDLLQTISRNNSSSLTTGNRNFQYPAESAEGNIFVVIENINIITPVGTTNPELGARVPLLPVSKEFLDAVYPSATGSSVPQFFAPMTQTTCVVGPWPDAAYTVEVVGTIRPLQLSSTNTTTFLSVNLPDLFFKAAMVEGCGYQQNFSTGGDNPQSAITWEAQYQAALKSAVVEEMRKKFGSEGWSSKQPDPVATPPRT